MSFRRAASEVAGLAPLAIVLGPWLAMLLATSVDRGPDGRPRLTAFRLALAVSDPAAWQASVNSLAIASAVAAVSLALGVILARIESGRRFWGRGALTTLIQSAGTAPPIFAALGLLGVMRRLGLEPDTGWHWTALVWAELCWGVPSVASAVSASLKRFDPAWDDPARLVGASARRRWKDLAWPLCRPAAARAAAEVFAVVLFEPGAPWILGIRRTLAYQAVQAATSGHEVGRAAALGLVALILGLVGRRLLLRWGGATWPLQDLISDRRPTRASLGGGLGRALVLAIAAAFSLAPTLGLVATAIDFRGWGSPSISAFHALLGDEDGLESLGHGLILGMGAGLAALTLGRIAARRPAARRVAASTGSIPPLALAIGWVAAPGLIDGLASALDHRGVLTHLAWAIHHLARVCDPYPWPWVALIAAVAASRFPGMVGALGSRIGAVESREIEVSRTLGASRFRSWATIAAPRRLIWLGRLLGWAVAISALDSSSAAILTPATAARPIAPTMVALSTQPGGLALASALAVTALILTLTARVVLGRQGGVNLRIRP